ncbi:MAG: tRNA pseudouridine(38-40) synthase TruA [Bacteroidales bacterium]|nr:tRNA pseudouridine(38-40) synthase TruA [Bacteroidales bacterium]
MMRHILRLSYDGGSFSGWQVQPEAASVQGEIEKALETLLRQPIGITGCGRTDTGVNACSYVAHFDAPSEVVEDAERLCCKLNAILPFGICIHEIIPASEDFHARFDAVSRSYRYFIHFNKDPFIGEMSWHCKYRLDVDRMNEAARELLGTRDFSCFEKSGGSNMTSICTITRAVWERWTPSHVRELGFPAAEGDYIVFTITADRFLRNMVRAIVGSLVDVGRGKRDTEWFRELISGGTRSDAGQSVPGRALFLKEIVYPDGAKRKI